MCQLYIVSIIFGFYFVNLHGIKTLSIAKLFGVFITQVAANRVSWYLSMHVQFCFLWLFMADTLLY